MSDNIHELIEQHQAFYEVLPFYVVQQTEGKTKRVQAGFDIDVYGIKPSHEQHPGRDYVLGYVVLKKLVEMISPKTGESCSLELISFPSSVVIDTKKQFQEEGMLRIRIARKGLEPAGKPEERVLHEVKERLQQLGLRQR